MQANTTNAAASEAKMAQAEHTARLVTELSVLRRKREWIGSDLQMIKDRIEQIQLELSHPL